MVIYSAQKYGKHSVKQLFNIISITNHYSYSYSRQRKIGKPAILILIQCQQHWNSQNKPGAKWWLMPCLYVQSSNRTHQQVHTVYKIKLTSVIQKSLEIIKHFNGEYRENNIISKDMHKIVNWELHCIVEQLCDFIGIESYQEWFLLKHQTSFFLMLWKWMEVLPSNERYTENSHFTKMA